MTQDLSSAPGAERPTPQEQARAIYVPRVVTHADVAEALGVSAVTVKRWLNPDYEARVRARSRVRKQERTGICERCGGVTHYNGKRVNGPSRICDKCAHEPWTHCARGHELSGDNLLSGRAHQRCRICRNAYMREYLRLRRREAGVPERGPYLNRRLKAEQSPTAERTA